MDPHFAAPARRPFPAPAASLMKSTILLAATLTLAPLCAAAQSPFRADACPLREGALGYPVWVRAADGAPLDSAYAHALADATARRWEPPSRRRGDVRGLSRLRTRLQPPEPRWPDDWAPRDSHVARVEVTLRRTGRPGAVTVVQPSGDRAFDRSLEGIFRDGAPGAPDLPNLSAADSVRVVVGFGAAPEPGAATVRFAVQQEPVRVLSLEVLRPPQSGSSVSPPSATAKYDVDVAGRVIPGSIELLDSPDRPFGEAVRAGLQRARFTPARSDCRAVAITVTQQFGGR